MGAVRRRSGRWEVAADTYIKQDRRVVIFGVSHVSGHDFWNSFSSYLSEMENLGFAIHYELVKNDMKKPPRISMDYRIVANLLGLQSQHEGLVIKDDWINTDVKLSQIVANSNPHKLARMAESARKAEDSMKEMIALKDDYPEEFKKAQEAIKRAMGVVMVGGSLLSKANISPLSGISNKQLIRVRDAVAAKAIVESEGDVVSIWGANHLSGIGKILKSNGFVLKHRQWHPAI